MTTQCWARLQTLLSPGFAPRRALTRNTSRGLTALNCPRASGLEPTPTLAEFRQDAEPVIVVLAQANADGRDGPPRPQHHRTEVDHSHRDDQARHVVNRCSAVTAIVIWATLG